MTTERNQSVNDDPIEDFLAGLQGNAVVDTEEEAADEEATDESVEEETDESESNDDNSDDQSEEDSEDEEDSEEEGSDDASEEQEPEQPKGLDLESLDTDAQLKVFNKVTGLNFTNIEDARKYAEVVNQWPKHQKSLELYPTLLEKLKSQQNVMSYFPDETAYKVAQLAKEEQYKGREAELTKLLRSNVSELNSIEIVRLFSALNAPEGVKNPFRYTIKRMGLEPDDVLENFDELSEDDQDLFNGFAFQSRKELAKIGADIAIPTSSNEDLEALLEGQLSSVKDDLEKKRTEIAPVLSSFIDGVTEIKVNDDFSFKLNLTKEDKDSYSSFLTQAVLNGDFDLGTDDGKKELFNALVDEIWVDNRQKILKAQESYLKSKYEKEFMAKFNNEKPLDKKTPPPPKGKTKSNPLVDVAEKMISDML